VCLDNETQIKKTSIVVKLPAEYMTFRKRGWIYWHFLAIILKDTKSNLK